MDIANLDMGKKKGTRGLWCDGPSARRVVMRDDVCGSNFAFALRAVAGEEHLE